VTDTTTTPASDSPATGPAQASLKQAFICLVILFSMGMIVYCNVAQKSDAIALATINAAFLTIGAVVGSWIFGKAWQAIRS
jgi:hypothetical protein